MVFKRGPKKLIRNFGNKLGLAWWAKVETTNPTTTYWYGPFLTKRGLNEDLEYRKAIDLILNLKDYYSILEF